MTDDTLRYPIGKSPYPAPNDISDDDLTRWIQEIAELPPNLRNAVAGLTEEQLETPYRDGGWTVRQVVHHVADSHINGYIRSKLALTEEYPTIKPYKEALWAELRDVRDMPIELSLKFLDLLHERLVILLKGLKRDEFERSYFHPENERSCTIGQLVANYAWHGKHHVAHIVSLRNRKGWKG